MVDVDRLTWVTAQGFQVNLDTYDDVAKDYRFYEDPGDEFRNPPDGASQTNKYTKQ